MLWTRLHGINPAIDQKWIIDVKYNLVECNNNNIYGLLTCKRTFSLTHFIWSHLACEWHGHVLTSISYYKIVYNPNIHVRYMTNTEKVSHKYLIWDTTGVIRGAGTAYTSGAPPVFSGVHVARSVVFWVDRFLLLLAILLSVLLRFFGIFKLFFEIKTRLEYS